MTPLDFLAGIMVREESRPFPKAAFGRNQTGVM